jgi:DNA-directed RNA polymerase specialized sigma24 family protein
LFGITRHLVRDWMARRHAERIAMALLPATEPVTERTVGEELHEAELRALVWTAIDAIPDLFRDIFIQTQIEHRRMPFVARHLGIPLRTGYTRLHLARERFLGAFLRLLARRGASGRKWL